MSSHSLWIDQEINLNNLDIGHSDDKIHREIFSKDAQVHQRWILLSLICCQTKNSTEESALYANGWNEIIIPSFHQNVSVESTLLQAKVVFQVNTNHNGNRVHIQIKMQIKNLNMFPFKLKVFSK